MERKEALDEIEEFLKKAFESAKKADRDLAKWTRAFPDGVIPELSDNGEIANISVYPNHVDHSHIDELLKQALNGDALAFDAVIVWAGWHLQGYRSIPHEEITTFVGRYLSGFNTRPAGNRGRTENSVGNTLQHAIIRHAVWMVKGWGFIVARDNKTEHADTACDIVADAMVSLKLRPASYDHIRRIWHSGLKLG
ncbi:hypothetical protein [Sulfitobacter sp. JB4-11]|uniref:hypothetical protein n=1 Tax=Sulfitobacter rhodophyticola TaxID=3238304 RepID=UPI003518A100